VFVMLDLDNTVADRQAAVEAWLAEFSHRHDLSPEVQRWILDLDNDGYSNRAEVFGLIKQRLDLDPPVEELLGQYQRRVVQLAVAMPGAFDCLQQMRERGWTLALVTNGSAAQQRGKIEALGLGPYFSAICVSGELGVAKPSSQIFEAAADMAGASLDGAWMVGDSAMNDVEGGRLVGAKTIWLAQGRVWPDDLADPTAVINSMAELVGVIDRN
jgi:putative hydrolase of the HAD superfamily